MWRRGFVNDGRRGGGRVLKGEVSGASWPRSRLKDNSLMYFSQKGELLGLYKEASFYTRALVFGFRNVPLFFPGDIVEVFFFRRGSSFIFEGVCLGVRRGFRRPDCTFVLRNYVHGVGIECLFSYYYNRLYGLRVHEFKKKSFSFARSKFFFLRERLQRLTAVR